MFEKILDKIDVWNSRLYDWQRTSDSRAALALCLHFMLIIPFAFGIVGVVGVLLVFFWWAVEALLGI